MSSVLEQEHTIGSGDRHPTGVLMEDQPARQSPLKSELCRDLVRFFKLLSDETRLRILHFLIQENELHVRALCDLLNQSQPAVSHHLALLRAAELIDSRRDGKHNYYRLRPERYEALLAVLNMASPGSPAGP